MELNSIAKAKKALDDADIPMYSRTVLNEDGIWVVRFNGVDWEVVSFIPWEECRV